jgi:hypothetical protein
MPKLVPTGTIDPMPEKRHRDRNGVIVAARDEPLAPNNLAVGVEQVQLVIAWSCAQRNLIRNINVAFTMSNPTLI